MILGAKSPLSGDSSNKCPAEVGATAVVTGSPVLTQKTTFQFCERETDIINDDIGGGSDDESAGQRRAFQGYAASGQIAPLDDPLLCEDILSCISALDEVIAEFDDSSLPYIYDDEGNQQVPPPPALSYTDQAMPSTSAAMGVGQQYFTTEDKLVLKTERANPVTSQSDIKPGSEEKFPINYIKSASHLIQIPSSKASKSSKSTSSFQSLEKSVSPSCSTSSSLSGKLATGSTSSRGSEASRTSEKIPGNGGISNSNSAPSPASGGTYSKGTNYEIVLPRIPSTSDKSGSSRNNVQQEPIYSSIGKSRPQLSLGIFTSEVRGGNGHLYPQEPEIDYNEEHDVDSFYKDNNGRLSGSGRMSKSSSGASFQTAPPQMTKEQWNFPSEKNLPRSLRKTRKTCLLDDEKGEKSKGKVSTDCDLGYNGEGVGANGSSAGGHSTASSSSSTDRKHYEAFNQNNGKNATRRDDSQKIYEHIVVISSNNPKTNKESNQYQSPPLSSSSSLSFNTSSSTDQPVPKPRVRQQIPKSEESSVMKYPPGRIPKPNPKPGSSQTEVGASSPFSPVQCEISRTEGEGLVRVGKISRPEKIGGAGAILHDSEQSRSSASNNVTPNVTKNLNNGPNTSNGHMMRMMMMMKPSAKNNSTGSASSISRSSSSSSGGDPNYYRKDNLSSSSGVVVTTNSSTTTASPTNSVNNNSLNNNITIINTEKVKGTSVVEVKGQNGQRRHPTGNKLGCQPHQLGANNKPAVVLTNGVLDVDDGYLSMINRNEAPLLWPEEFIENETFSPDELKRLSVHLPEEDTSSSDSDSCSEEKEIELEIVDYDKEPSRRHPHHNRSLKSISAPINRRNTHSTREKTEYFSDDSLEGETEQEMHFQKPRGNSVSPYLGMGYSSVSSADYSPKSHGANRNVTSFTSASSPSHHQYRQQITVNTALVHPTNGQQSRIPKMISGSNSKKSGRTDSKSAESLPEVAKRKPCSFFVSLNDEATATEVKHVSSKSSTPSMGSQISISPVKNTPKEESTQPDQPTQTQVDVDVNHSPNLSNLKSSKQLVAGSNLPQLRHTKSINTGGPRLRGSNNNANKRKSTSDLVTVVALNHDTQSDNGEHESTTDGDLSADAHVVVTSSFNRTSTFLIPSPCSRTVDEHVTRKKRQIDDETDNDEDDFSSDFDPISATDLDSLPPLSLNDVHNFVSEIMDTALRRELQRTQMAINNYSVEDAATTNDMEHPPQLTGKAAFLDISNCNSESKLPHKKHAKQVDSKKSKREDEQEQSVESGEKVGLFSCGSTSNKEAEVDRDQIGGNDRTTVAEQLEAVVSNFLSDNQSFLGQGEEEEGDEKSVADNECNLVRNPINPTERAKGGDANDGDGELVEVSLNGELETDDVRSPEENSSGLEVTVLDLPTTDDNLTEALKPLMNSMVQSVHNKNGGNGTLRDSSLLGEEKILDLNESDSSEEDSEEQPPAFIPPPPSQLLSSPPTQIIPPIVSQKNFLPESRNRFGNGNLHHLHNSNVREGKAALDILAERISNSKKFRAPDDQFQVSQFIHDKRNIWAMYDRPFDEDLLPANSGARGYASRSQENIMDAMTKERFHKSFSGRGQSSTLPLNCRPLTTQRRSSTFRNMFNKFRKNKHPGPVIKEIPEYHDDEVQSITSRETGPSEQGKKRGFFSRLFRRSKKP